MATTRVRALVDAYLEAVRSLDPAAIVFWYALDAELRDPTLDAPLRGRDAIAEYYAAFADVQSADWDSVEVFTRGRTAVAWVRGYRLRFRALANLPVVFPPTAMRFEERRGLIWRHEELFDTSPVRRQYEALERLAGGGSGP